MTACAAMVAAVFAAFGGEGRTDERAPAAVAPPEAVAPGSLGVEPPIAAARERAEPNLTPVSDAAAASGAAGADAATTAELRGSVRHFELGMPVGGTRIDVVERRPGASARVVGSATSGADGSYRIAGLPAGIAEVRVEHLGLAAPRWADVMLAAGGTTVHDVLLHAGLTIRGRVLDALSGAPIAGALVAPAAASDGVRTDAAGAFELAGFPAEHELALRVEAAGYATAEPVLRAHGSPPSATRTSVEVRLARGRRARGVVQDAAGVPLAGVQVVAAAADHEGDGGTFRFDRHAAASGADGAFVLEGLRPDMPHTLRLACAGHGTRVVAFPTDEAAQELVELGTLRLSPAASVHGIVVDERGAPVVGHEVELLLRDLGRWPAGTAPPDEYRAVDAYVATARGATDAVGRFRLGDLPPGAHELRVMKLDSHEQIVLACDVAAGADVGPLRVELLRGLTLSGRIVPSDGGAVPKCYCSVDPRDGQGTSADVEAAPDGTFAARGLAPGLYRVTVYAYPSGEDQRIGRTFAACAIDAAAGGAPVRCDLAATTRPR